MLLKRGQTPNVSEVLYARAASLHEAEVDEEIVGLDRDQGEVFGFNKVASDVWRLLEKPQSAAALSAALQRNYEVAPAQCDEDLNVLLDQLIELKIVKRIITG